MNPIPIRFSDNGEWLYLLSPRIRYMDESSGEDPDAGFPRNWVEVGESEWVYDNGRLKIYASVRPHGRPGFQEPFVLTLSVTAIKPVRVALCTVEMMSPSPTQPYCIDRFLRWRNVRDTVSLNDYSPMAVRWGAGAERKTEIRTFKGFVSCKLSWQRQQLKLAVNLDAAALHPRWQFTEGGRVSTAAPIWAPGKSLSVSLLLSVIDENVDSPPILVSRFPGGAEASFTLTDHSDFDTSDALKTFMSGDGAENGWINRGLRLTKGVFALASTTTERESAASLQDGKYKKLVTRLYKDGSEVAPHALNQFGNITSTAYKAKVREFSLQWSPETWIDHGNTIHYCYTMGGGDNPEYNLLDELGQNGFKVLWSYQDAPADAAASLNLLALPVSDWRPIAARIFSHLSHARVGVALHYLRSALHWHLRGPAAYAAIQIISALRNLGMALIQTRRISPANLSKTWAKVKNALHKAVGEGSDALREPHTRQELLDMAAVLYPERAVPLNQVNESELVLFTTGEALHTCDIYSTRALQRLIAERGLHIGHCYLLNRLPYIAGIFERKAGTPRLTPEWAGFVDWLSELVGSGRIWNPTMADLAGWMRAMQHVECVPMGAAEVQITNTLPWQICDFTLLVPRTISPGAISWADSAVAGWRYWEDWLAVWGNLPANGQVSVSWGEAAVAAGLAGTRGSRGRATVESKKS